MSSPDLTCVLRLKSNAMRGGVLENIFMRNINVGLVKDSVLQIDFLYEEGARGEFMPVARNVVMENIKVAQTPRVLNVKGFPGASIEGCDLDTGDDAISLNPAAVWTARGSGNQPRMS